MTKNLSRIDQLKTAIDSLTVFARSLEIIEREIEEPNPVHSELARMITKAKQKLEKLKKE